MFQQQPQNSLFGGGGFSQSQPQFPSGGQSSFMGQPSGGFYGPTGANNFTFNYQNQPQLPAGTQQAMQGRMQEMRYAQPNAVRYGSNIAGTGPMAGGLAGAYLQQGIAPALDEMQSMYGQAGQNIGESIAALAPVTATPVAPAPAPTPTVSSAPAPAPVAPAPAPVYRVTGVQNGRAVISNLAAPAPVQRQFRPMATRQEARAATRAARQETRAAKTRQPAPVAAPAGSFASIFGNVGASAKSQRLAKKWSKR
jgi:hypothetical protein